MESSSSQQPSVSKRPLVQLRPVPSSNPKQPVRYHISAINPTTTNECERCCQCVKKLEEKLEKNEAARLLEAQEAKEANANLMKQIEQMNRKLDKVLAIQAIERNRLTEPRRPSFSMEPIASTSELKSFDDQLGASSAFRERVQRWLSMQADAITGDNRMHQTIDLLFTKELFAKCNWSGTSFGPESKISIQQFSNVLNLFKFIGSSREMMVSQATLNNFFQKKLKYAKRRLNITGVRTSSCHDVCIKKFKTSPPSEDEENI